MKLYDKVKTILENYPETRNSDKKLIWRIWKELGLIYGVTYTHDDGIVYGRESIQYDNFMKAPSTESVRRCRQKIQSLHPELEPTSEVIRKRRRIKANTKGTFIFREDTNQGVFI